MHDTAPAEGVNVAIGEVVGADDGDVVDNSDGSTIGEDDVSDGAFARLRRAGLI